MTVCAAGHRRLFGTVVNERMVLNDAGHAAATCWRSIPAHFPHAVLDEWVVMPNHIHGIIVIERDGHPVGAKHLSPPNHSTGHSTGPLGNGAKDFSPLPCGTSRTIGSIVRGFKIGVTKWLRGDSPWQRNYYEIIVRDARALNNVRAYIRNNPAHWDVLRYGEPDFSVGDRALLDKPLTAFLASRGGSHAPPIDMTLWTTRPACVVSGFLSPMERAVFDACLADGIPVIQLLARGLPAAFPRRIRRAIDAGRLLVVTPVEPTQTRFNAARAAWCNQYALHLAATVMIGQFNPDGMLACLLTDLPRGKKVITLSHIEACCTGALQNAGEVPDVRKSGR